MFQWNVPLEQGQGARSDFFSDFCGFSDVHTLFQWNKKSPNGHLVLAISIRLLATLLATIMSVVH